MKKIKQKDKGVILLILLSMIVGEIISQGHRIDKIKLEDFDLVESYTVEETSQIIKPKGVGVTNLNVIDQMLVKPRKEVYHVLNTLSKKGEVTTTILHERPEHVEKWIAWPSKTIITETGAIMYDSDGKFMFEKNHNENEKKVKKDAATKVKANGKFQDVDFTNLTGKEKDEIAKNKGNIKKLSFFAEEVEYDTLILRNIPENMVKQTIFRKDKKDKGLSVAMKYKYNTEEDIVLERITSLESKAFVFKNGIEELGYDQSITNIIDYEIYKDLKYKKIKGRSNNSFSSPSITLISTLIVDNYLGLTLDYPDGSKTINGGPLILRIYDLLGQQVDQHTLNDHNGLISIDISKLNSGSYFLKSNLSINDSPRKFIKI